MFFAVGDARFPEAEEDMLPFIGKAAEDALVPVAELFLLLVVGFGPE